MKENNKELDKITEYNRIVLNIYREILIFFKEKIGLISNISTNIQIFVDLNINNNFIAKYITNQLNIFEQIEIEKSVSIDLSNRTVIYINIYYYFLFQLRI